MCPLQDPSQKREVPERSDFKSSAMCGTPRMLHQAPFGAQGENPERMSSRTTNFNPREEFCLSIVDSPSVTLVVAWLLTSHEGTLAAMVEPRHCTVQHSEGLVQGGASIGSSPATTLTSSNLMPKALKSNLAAAGLTLGGASGPSSPSGTGRITTYLLGGPPRLLCSAAVLM